MASITYSCRSLCNGLLSFYVIFDDKFNIREPGRVIVLIIDSYLFFLFIHRPVGNYRNNLARRRRWAPFQRSDCLIQINDPILRKHFYYLLHSHAQIYWSIKPTAEGFGCTPPQQILFKGTHLQTPRPLIAVGDVGH